MEKVTLFLISFFLLLCGVGFAQQKLDVNHLPELERYITDFTDTLTLEELNELEAIAENYYEASTNQLVAVVIPDRQGRELFDIGIKIFNENGIGEKGKNNGLLLLIAKNEKKIRIVVWYGLEDEIPDLKASRIIENSIRPLVDKGQLFEAIKVFYVESQKAIDGSVIDAVRHRMVQGGKSSDFMVMLAFFLWVVTGTIIQARLPSLASRGVRKRENNASLRWTILVVIGIFWLIGGGIAVMVYLVGIAVGLGILNSGRGGRSWGRRSSGGRSGGKSGGGFFGWGGRIGGGFSGGGGRSGGGGAGD